MPRHKLSQKHLIYAYLLVVLLLLPVFACTFTNVEAPPARRAEVVPIEPVLNAGASAQLVQVDFKVEILQPSNNQTVPFTDGGSVDIYVYFEDAPRDVERIQVDIRNEETGEALDPPLSVSVPFENTTGTVLLRWVPKNPSIYLMQARVLLRPEPDSNRIPYNDSEYMTVLSLDNARVAATQTWESVVATATADSYATATATALLGLACKGTVLIIDLNKREGPSSNARVIGNFQFNEPIEILGQSPNGSWLFIRDSSGREVWATNNDRWVSRDPNNPLCDDLPIAEFDQP